MDEVARAGRGADLPRRLRGVPHPRRGRCRHSGARDAAPDGRTAAGRGDRDPDPAGSGEADPGPRQVVRFQHGNHLGSVVLELDAAGQIISYEELHPYGSTAYCAVRPETETPKRYRYTGKERDEETGFSYHGARYYAPWLARWTTPDPAGVGRNPNAYRYVLANPVKLVDPDGREEQQCVIHDPAEEAQKAARAKADEQTIKELERQTGKSYTVLALSLGRGPGGLLDTGPGEGPAPSERQVQAAAQG